MKTPQASCQRRARQTTSLRTRASGAPNAPGRQRTFCRAFVLTWRRESSRSTLISRYRRTCAPELLLCKAAATPSKCCRARTAPGHRASGSPCLTMKSSCGITTPAASCTLTRVFPSSTTSRMRWLSSSASSIATPSSSVRFRGSSWSRDPHTRLASPQKAFSAARLTWTSLLQMLSTCRCASRSTFSTPSQGVGPSSTPPTLHRNPMVTRETQSSSSFPTRSLRGSPRTTSLLVLGSAA